MDNVTYSMLLELSRAFPYRIDVYGGQIKREQCDVISTPGFSRLVDSPISLRSITDATIAVSRTISPTKMTPVTCKVDAHPDFCKLLQKERNTSSKVNIKKKLL